MTAPGRLTVTATRLAADPLAAAGDPELLAAREHLGFLLEAAGPAEAPDDLEADVDLIVRYADQATFQPDTDDGKAALTALARVTALLAALPGGIDFAGRHWRAAQPSTRHPEAAAAAASRAAPAGQFLRKSTGSYYTPPELIAELLKSSLMPQVAEALTAADPEKALAEVTVCDPACGAGAFLVAAARLLSWYSAMTRAGREGSISAELPAARRQVVTGLIHGVDISPLATDITRLVLSAQAYVPGLPNPYLGHRVKCGNSLIGAQPGLMARGIPDGAYKPLPGDDPALAAAARKRNKAERDAWLRGPRAAGPRPPAPPLAAMARAGEWTSAGQAHRELENSPEVRLAKRVADAWCAAFVWPHAPGGPEPVTTGTLLHLATGGPLAPDAEDTLDSLRRQYQFFHWHLEFPGVFRPPGGPGSAEKPRQQPAPRTRPAANA